MYILNLLWREATVEFIVSNDMLTYVTLSTIVIYIFMNITACWLIRRREHYNIFIDGLIGAGKTTWIAEAMAPPHFISDVSVHDDCNDEDELVPYYAAINTSNIHGSTEQTSKIIIDFQNNRIRSTLDAMLDRHIIDYKPTGMATAIQIAILEVSIALLKYTAGENICPYFNNYFGDDVNDILMFHIHLMRTLVIIFLCTRIAYAEFCNVRNIRHVIVMFDRSIIGDLTIRAQHFLAGRISREQFNSYLDIVLEDKYKCIMDVPCATMLIGTCPVNAISNIAKRGRPSESSIPIEYLTEADAITRCIYTTTGADGGDNDNMKHCNHAMLCTRQRSDEYRRITDRVKHLDLPKISNYTVLRSNKCFDLQQSSTIPLSEIITIVSSNLSAIIQSNK